jgi:hypothetical protein
MDNGLKNIDDLLRGIFSHMRNVGLKKRSKDSWSIVMDLGLRTSGYTFEEIAQSIGYKSASGDLYAVEKALDRVPAPEVHKFRKLNLGRLNPILRTWWPLMVGDRTIADRAVATDRIRGAIHDIRQLYGLDVPIPKEPTPGSTRDNSLHVSAVPGQID